MNKNTLYIVQFADCHKWDFSEDIVGLFDFLFVRGSLGVRPPQKFKKSDINKNFGLVCYLINLRFGRGVEVLVGQVASLLV